MFKSTSRRALALLAVMASAAALAVVPATGAGAAAAPKEQHCVVNVTGQKATGEYTVSPTRCYSTLAQARADGATYASASMQSGGVAALSGSNWLATHYDGHTFTGSSLDIYGGACSDNGWLNLSPAWNNKISSTDSICGVWHADGSNLTGAVEYITAPGGELTTLDNRTGSIQYSA